MTIKCRHCGANLMESNTSGVCCPCMNAGKKAVIYVAIAKDGTKSPCFSDEEKEEIRAIDPDASFKKVEVEPNDLLRIQRIIKQNSSDAIYDVIQILTQMLV